MNKSTRDQINWLIDDTIFLSKSLEITHETCNKQEILDIISRYNEVLMFIKGRLV